MNNNSKKNIAKNASRAIKNDKAGSGLHTRGYKPSGPNTSEGCTPPNVGTGVNKKSK